MPRPKTSISQIFTRYRRYLRGRTHESRQNLLWCDPAPLLERMPSQLKQNKMRNIKCAGKSSPLAEKTTCLFSPLRKTKWRIQFVELNRTLWDKDAWTGLTLFLPEESRPRIPDYKWILPRFRMLTKPMVRTAHSNLNSGMPKCAMKWLAHHRKDSRAENRCLPCKLHSQMHLQYRVQYQYIVPVSPPT